MSCSVTCFESIVRVAGATFTETGVHSFLSLLFTAVLSASLITSIPKISIQESYNRTHDTTHQHIVENINHDQDTKSIINILKAQTVKCLHKPLYIWRCFLTNWLSHRLTTKVINMEVLEEFIFWSRKLC